jgi:hypothetical protein
MLRGDEEDSRASRRQLRSVFLGASFGCDAVPGLGNAIGTNPLLCRSRYRRNELPCTAMEQRPDERSSNRRAKSSRLFGHR